jgi:hypothetical protein
MALDQQETTPAHRCSSVEREGDQHWRHRVQPTHGDVTVSSIDNDRICWLIRMNTKPSPTMTVACGHEPIVPRSPR